MRYPHFPALSHFLALPYFSALIITLSLIAGTSTAVASDADFYRQKAEAAFADQRYLQAASYAAEVLAEKGSDKRMHILLVRASDKMGASRQHVSNLYQQALKNYPSDANLLAFAAEFYSRLGYQNYALKLASIFDKTCAFNCPQMPNQSETAR